MRVNNYEIVNSARILVIDGNKVLAVSRKNDHTDFGLPGGKLEAGETFEECAVREAKEKTGYDVEVIQEVFTSLSRKEKNLGIRSEFYEAKTFLCHIVGGEMGSSEKGVVAWVSWDELINGTFGDYNKSLYDKIYPGITKLVGKTLAVVEKSRLDDSIIFTTTDGVQYEMSHVQECCECVQIEDIDGDLQDLVGLPILQAEESTNCETPVPDGADSFMWTYYKLATIKGYVTIRWLGESNGSYSEGVDFERITPYYGKEN